MDLLSATRLKSLLAALLLTAFAAAPLAAATAPASRSCEQLKQWLLDHRSELPRDYLGLQAYELAERRAIYSDFSPEEKAAFWQDKVAAYLGGHPDLPADQVAAIRKAAAAFRPEIYRPGAPTEPLAKVDKEARAALGDEIVQEVLYGLGPEKAAGGNARPGLDLPGCNCLTLVDCPRPRYKQCEEIDGCLLVGGCGLGGSQACINLCTP